MKLTELEQKMKEKYTRVEHTDFGPGGYTAYLLVGEMAIPIHGYIEPRKVAEQRRDFLARALAKIVGEQSLELRTAAELLTSMWLTHKPEIGEGIDPRFRDALDAFAEIVEEER